MSGYQLSESKSVSMMKFLALCFFVISLINIPIAEARIRHYKFELKYEYKSPDCYKKLVITINGRTPGPTIFAQQNDTVIVEVKNSLLTENTAIHWHGIRQIGTPWFDGTEGVTQCPILPGDTFVYKFVVDRVSPQVLTLCNALLFHITCMIVTSCIFYTAWDILISCPLWNAKRSWDIWIDSGSASRWRIRTLCL
jgi:hypothetical protein